jgi:cytochrome c oxidase subunit 4
MTSHVVPLRVYFFVFIALMVLLLLTIGAALLDLGTLSVLITLIIASTKALLILLYFMHIRYSDKIAWIYAGAGFFWLLILLVFTLSDYVTRS